MQLATKKQKLKVCEGYALEKDHNHPFPTHTLVLWVQKARECFHIDMCRPMNTNSFARSQYFVLFKDDFNIC